MNGAQAMSAEVSAAQKAVQVAIEAVSAAVAENHRAALAWLHAHCGGCSPSQGDELTLWCQSTERAVARAQADVEAKNKVLTEAIVMWHKWGTERASASRAH